MVRGLLDGIIDPEVMAQYGERHRIVERIAEQAGLTLPEAMVALERFEECNCSAGQELH